MNYTHINEKIFKKLLDKVGGGGGSHGNDLVIDTEPHKIGTYQGRPLYAQLFITELTSSSSDVKLFEFPKDKQIVHYSNTLYVDDAHNTIITDYYASSNDQFHVYINDNNVTAGNLGVYMWSSYRGIVHTVILFTEESEE